MCQVIFAICPCSSVNPLTTLSHSCNKHRKPPYIQHLTYNSPDYFEKIDQILSLSIKILNG